MPALPRLWPPFWRRIWDGSLSLAGFSTLLFLVNSLSFGQTPSTIPVDGVRNVGISYTAIDNVRIVVDSKQTIEKGSILLRDGKIQGVGANLKVPEGTKRIDLKGKTVYPGWIDAYTEADIAAPDSSKGAPYWNSNIVPQRNASESYQPNADQLTKFRKAGITAILVSPSGGIVRGKSCLVATNNNPAEKSLLAGSTADHLRLTLNARGAGGTYPSSPMGAVALARQAYLDTDWYRKAWQAYRSQPGLPQPENNAALQSIVESYQSNAVVVIDTLNEQAALRADHFAREFGLKAVLRGSGREYRLLDAIAATHRPLIIPVNFPKAPNVSSPELVANVLLQDLMHWELAPENPGRLVAAGCKICLTSDGLDDPNELRTNVRAAIERGLTPESALDALTRHPAELFGVDNLLGSIAVGKWANLIITDGDIWGEKTKIDETWVQGERHRWSEEKPLDISGDWNLKVVEPIGKPSELVLKLTEGKLSGSLALPKPKSPEVSPEGTPAKSDVTPEKEEPPSPSDKTKGDPPPETPDGAEKGEPKDAPKETKSPDSKEEKKPEFGTAKLERLQRQDLRLSGTFDQSKIQRDSEGIGQLSVVALNDSRKEQTSLQGTVVWADGTRNEVVGSRDTSAKDADASKVERKGEGKRDEKKGGESKKKTKEVLSKANFPLGEYGKNGLPEQAEWVLIRGATLWLAGPKQGIEKGDILLHQGFIAAVGGDIEAPSGATIIDGKDQHVTPGIIDCHSHMATDGGVNEAGQAVTAEVRISDFIDANDYTIYCQLAGGVTAANVLHGSANPIGGQNQVIKLRWGGLYEDLKMKEAPAGIKFALGENVKQSNRSEPGDRYPQSRMGVEQIIRDRFEAAREYQKSWKDWNKNATGLPPRRDLELEAISEILQGERWIHCHSYRQDEILAMLRTLEDYGVQIGTLQHILEGYKVAEAMAKHGAMASSFSDWWGYKFEVIDAVPFNGALMHRMGIVVSFNSDDNELGRHLNHEAAKAVKYGGVPEVEALKFVTLNPAKQLRIENYVGSLEVGKQADIVIWSGSPLSSTSRCEQTWIDGRKYFDRKSDSEMRLQAEELHNKLVQKVLASDGPTAAPGERTPDPTAEWLRYDEYCRTKASLQNE